MLPYSKLEDDLKNFEQPKTSKNKLWRIFKIIFFVFIIFVVTVSFFSYTVLPSDTSIVAGIGRLPVIKQFRQLMGLEKLEGELSDKINFLILGQGGPGHDGPYLTDTIMLGSYKPSTNDLALISIPRDLYVEIEGHGYNKINSANSFGETGNYPGGGSAFTAKTIEKIFGIPIHYWIRFDFKAFEEIINSLDGIEVCVDKTFTDPSYPTDDSLTETITFNAGCQKMDSATALKFARSRHGNNGEGSDFARSARQQKIIMAVKEKIFNLSFLTSPTKLTSLFNSLKNNLQTNVALSKLPDIISLAKNIDQNKIKRIVLDNSAKGLLKADVTDQGAYVLLPRVSDYSELKNLAENIFIIQNGHDLEPVRVAVFNGTKIEGLARDTAGFLNSVGFEIVATGNASSTLIYEKTVIYSLANDVREDVLSVLQKSLNANVAPEIPEYLKKQVENTKKEVNILIVLGCNPKNDEKCQTEKGNP